MTNKPMMLVPRELLERWLKNTDFFEDLRGVSMQEINEAKKEDENITDELRAVLAQEAGHVEINQCDGCRAGKPLENGKLHVMANAGGYRDVMACTAHLYTEPVAFDLSELREYHAKAISNLKSYANDCGLRDSDIKHYTKRADFHASMVALIDKVKELNQ